MVLRSEEISSFEHLIGIALTASNRDSNNLNRGRSRVTALIAARDLLPVPTLIVDGRPSLNIDRGQDRPSPNVDRSPGRPSPNSDRSQGSSSTNLDRGSSGRPLTPGSEENRRENRGYGDARPNMGTRSGAFSGFGAGGVERNSASRGQSSFGAGSGGGRSFGGVRSSGGGAARGGGGGHHR